MFSVFFHNHCFVFGYYCVIVFLIYNDKDGMITYVIKHEFSIKYEYHVRVLFYLLIFELSNDLPIDFSP